MNKLIPATNMLLAMCLLTACSSTGQVISAPGVSLRNVELVEIDFSGQTFVLGFDVTNPNPFPLPISTVSYGVKLGGYHFAGGQTRGGFTVPASGDGEFAISVELDLLRTAPQMLHIVRGGEQNDIAYELKGQLGIDIPFAKPISFKSSGTVRLQAPARQALQSY